MLLVIVTVVINVTGAGVTVVINVTGDSVTVVINVTGAGVTVVIVKFYIYQNVPGYK